MATGSESYRRIYQAVRRIPRGRVANYGQVAKLAGLAGRARQVGYALHALDDDSTVPWHRVVNAKGEVSLAPAISGAIQRQLLERDDAPMSVPSQPQLIPLPRHLAPGTGQFTLGAETPIAVSDGAQPVAQLLADVLRLSTGLPLAIVTDPARAGDIALKIDQQLEGAEAYELEVSDAVTIRAATHTGLFYDCQTLRQLLPAAIEAQPGASAPTNEVAVARPAAALAQAGLAN